MKNCPVCSAQIVRARPTGPLPDYCSRSCKEKAYYARRKERGTLPLRPRARYERTCPVCAGPFVASRTDTRTCSERCREKARPKRCMTPGHHDRPVRARNLCATCYNDERYGASRHEKPSTCETCGNQYGAKRSGQRYCSLLCRSGGQFLHTYTEEERRASREHRRARRALLRTLETERFDEREIYDRDGWRCQIEGCGKSVSKRIAWPHPMSASLDHVIPLTEPGTSHTRRNVRLAHLVCNTKRNNKGGNEQLALIG